MIIPGTKKCTNASCSLLNLPLHVPPFDAHIDRANKPRRALKQLDSLMIAICLAKFGLLFAARPANDTHEGRRSSLSVSASDGIIVLEAPAQGSVFNVTGSKDLLHPRERDLLIGLGNVPGEVRERNLDPGSGKGIGGRLKGCMFHELRGRANLGDILDGIRGMAECQVSSELVPTG
jgi:hypothetical protein